MLIKVERRPGNVCITIVMPLMAIVLSADSHPRALPHLLHRPCARRGFSPRARPVAQVLTAYFNFLIRELYDSRINLLVTLLLTLIALQLVIADFLPQARPARAPRCPPAPAPSTARADALAAQVDYFTWLHEFHAACDVFVIAMLLASIMQFRTKDETHQAIARVINFLATWILPLAIVVTWVLFFTVFRGAANDLEDCADPDVSELQDRC